MTWDHVCLSCHLPCKKGNWHSPCCSFFWRSCRNNEVSPQVPFRQTKQAQFPVLLQMSSCFLFPPPASLLFSACFGAIQYSCCYKDLKLNTVCEVWTHLLHIWRSSHFSCHVDYKYITETIRACVLFKSYLAIFLLI